MAPLLALVTLFYLYPAVEVVRLSLTNSSLLARNYGYTLGTLWSTLTDPTTYDVIWITFKFVIASIVGQLSLGLLIALAVQRGVARRLPGSVFVRTVVLSAWILPGVVIGILWQIVLNEAPYGLVTSALSAVGIGTSIPFLSEPGLALWSVTLANVWRGTAFSMILQYAGLQSISPELYEAAQVDGASPLQQFRYVTLPQLRPHITINLILITIATFNTFDMILSLTGGGPGRATEVLALRAYNVIFREFSLGKGSVLALLMLTFSLLMTVGYLRLLRRAE
jgi:multiple sugar transport system permease protein